MLTKENKLRDVRFSSGLIDVPDHRLVTWDAYARFSTGQHKIGYAFYPSGAKEPLFTGEDCGVAPSDPIDSDGAIVGLLSFMSLKPGDTDKEYFENYTPAQLEWTDSYACETLGLIPYDAENAHGNQDPECDLRWRSDGRLVERESGKVVFRNRP